MGPYLKALMLMVVLSAPSLGAVVSLQLEGAITPASDDLVRAAIGYAEESGSDALVIQLDTPGGGLSETLEIINIIERSNIPVIGYVSPPGAKAWSAGTMILMSTDIAAMAPSTIIGSAQPVRLLPTGATEAVNDTKTTNAIVALIEEKAKAHNRNRTAAREFVLSNLNLNAEEALEYGVIEYVSKDIDDLLIAINGSTAKNRSLITAGARIEAFEPDIRLRVLMLLSDPMIAGLLLLVGLYALIFGISNPGIGAEVFGVIAIALGLIGQGFDVNIGALFLIVLGMGLIVAELHTHTLGVLGVAGLICIVIGTILFAPIGFPQWYLPGEYQWSVIKLFLLPSLTMAIFFAFAIYKIAEVRLRPTFEETAERYAEAIETIDPRGYVIYRGEYWKAESDERIEKGERVEVLGVKDQTLRVRRLR